jgi:lipopolysaccharide biosynthesis regulator YciM
MSTAEPTAAGTAAHAKVLEAEHELEQATSARQQDPTRLAAAIEQAVDACRRWPEAASGVLYLPELLGELSEAYEQLGRTEDALDAMRSAITAGYTGAPRSFQDHVSLRILKGRCMTRPASRLASVMSRRPARWWAPTARLRRPAMTRGPDLVWTVEWSSR